MKPRLSWISDCAACPPRGPFGSYNDVAQHVARELGVQKIAVMDDDPRLIVGYGVFQDATAENTIQVSKSPIANYVCPREIFYAQIPILCETSWFA